MGITANYQPKSTELTQREKDVLVGVAQGKTNREIAISLKISRTVVENYLVVIRQKLVPLDERRTREQLVDYAVQHGIISLETNDETL